jgi:Glutaredoxin
VRLQQHGVPDPQRIWCAVKFCDVAPAVLSMPPSLHAVRYGPATRSCAAWLQLRIHLTRALGSLMLLTTWPTSSWRLNVADVDFQSRNVLADPELREAIKKFSNWPTIPQVPLIRPRPPCSHCCPACPAVLEVVQSPALLRDLSSHMSTAGGHGEVCRNGG